MENSKTNGDASKSDKKGGKETEYSYDQVSFQNKIKEFMKEVTVELKDHSYEQRCNWISDMKESGNSIFKE